jgi:hypothetical protein
LILRWGWVEAGHAATIGRYPINSASSFEQIVDDVMRQALLDAISRELVAVESAQTVTGATPRETEGVPNNAQDKIARLP